MQATIIAADSGNVLLPAAPDLIYGSIAFAIVAVAIYFFAWPAYSRLLNERAEKIDEGLKAAETAREEVATERAALDNQVNEARREAAEIRERASENAKAIVADAQARAQGEASSILDANSRRIAADSAAASKALKGEIGTLATELAGRIVGEAITDQAVASRVIDRFLNELEASVSAESNVGVNE